MASTKASGCAEPSAAPASSSVLLAATSCVLDHPVEVQLRDGSAYSGFFHAARTGDGYSVIIKRARKIRKGWCNSNGEIEADIDTLVVLSSDLVQVIAKEVPLQPRRTSGNGPDYNVERVGEYVGLKDCDNATDENQRKHDYGETSSLLNGYQNEYPTANLEEINKRSDFSVKEMPSKPSGEIENRNLGAMIFERVSKLNPSARPFQPSYASPVVAPSTTLSVASEPFIPSNTAFLPIGGMQPSVEVSSLGSHPASVPTKLVVYNNLAFANYASAQHSRPVVAEFGNRSLMARPNVQHYIPTHMGAAYLHPVSQTALADRAAHHLYGQPSPQDMVQMTLPELALPPPLPPPPRPLISSHHFNMPKIQSTPAPAVQLCATPLVLPGQPQLYPPFGLPVHIVPTILVPGGTGAYGSKLYP